MSKLKREYTTLRIYHDTKQRLTNLRTECTKDNYNYSEFIDLLMDVWKGRGERDREENELHKTPVLTVIDLERE